MSNIKLVCFDLDDTLIREIHSVMFLCILNGKYEQLLEIEKRELSGELDWIEADYNKTRLIKGLDETEIQKEFDDILKPLANIALTADTLRRNNIQSIIITAGPKQVAKAATEKWGFDDYYGSDYEVVDGVFTGEILTHVGDTGKIACLQNYCNKRGIQSAECVAVGDGSTDIPLFEYCKTSIAVNSSPAVAGKATHYLRTNDIYEVMQYIIHIT